MLLSGRQPAENQPQIYSTRIQKVQFTTKLNDSPTMAKRPNFTSLRNVLNKNGTFSQFWKTSHFRKPVLQYVIFSVERLFHLTTCPPFREPYFFGKTEKKRLPRLAAAHTQRLSARFTHYESFSGRLGTTSLPRLVIAQPGGSNQPHYSHSQVRVQSYHRHATTPAPWHGATNVYTD